jgi:hypothetical protein
MMVIQQVIVMSNQPLVQSGQVAGPPNEAEYNAVYAAVTATERGRRFLAEYANRNRSANTDLVMAAIARIEAAIGAGAAPQPFATMSRDLAASRTVMAASMAAPIAPARAGGGERDDDAASARNSPPLGGIADAEARKDRDYSEAVAAIAASLTARVGEMGERAAQDFSAKEDLPQLPERKSDAVEIALAEAATPQRRVPQDNAPRWHIEAPDFVFGEGSDQDNNGGAKPAGESALSQSQLLGAALLSEKADDLFKDPAPAAVEPAPVAETPRPSSPLPAEVVPLVDIARPQLRIANDPAPVNQHPRRYDSLTMTNALSEDEVIALFG